jgi:hypothetical protein
MPNDDQYSEAETAKRRDEVIKRMLNTPQRPHSRQAVVHVHIAAGASGFLVVRCRQLIPRLRWGASQPASIDSPLKC